MNETVDVTAPVLCAVTSLQYALFWRQNCGNFRTMDGRRVVHVTSIDGIADIMGIYRGKAVAIETKVKSRTLRKSQAIFRTNWEAAGGVYIIARNVDEALEALKGINS